MVYLSSYSLHARDSSLFTWPSMDDAALEVVSCGGAAHVSELNNSLAARRPFRVSPLKMYDSYHLLTLFHVKFRRNAMVLLCYMLSTASGGVARC